MFCLWDQPFVAYRTYISTKHGMLKYGGRVSQSLRVITIMLIGSHAIIAMLFKCLEIIL